jgi:hypothetical protein
MKRAALSSLGPLLAAITIAEEISRDVSARQALLAPARLARTLRRQSWQEAAHAAVFRTALHCLPGRYACPPAVHAALSAYTSRLHADLDRGALAASMVGLHCVLEGFAAVALQPPAGALAAGADTLVPLRPFILHQEQAHQRLGEVWVPRLLPITQQRASSAGEYCALADALLEAGLAEFECLQEDAASYRERVAAELRSTMRKLGQRSLESAH